MIIKSSQRSGAVSLANHLLNLEENEQVIADTSRGLLVDDLREALSDMEDMALGTRCQKPFYHVSINPAEDQEMDGEKWQRTWQQFEREYGLEEQPYYEVTHLKKGREHKHRVYSRITDERKAVQLSYTRIRNEKVSRILEYEFGHELTVGKHNKSVIAHLKKEGRGEVAQWLEQEKAHEVARPVAQKNHRDKQQEERTKISVEQVKVDLKEAYQSSDNGHGFEAAIAQRGYVLARGDKRDFVVVDGAGGVHSPRRRLGVKVKELREKWADLDKNHLPTVDDVRQGLLERQRDNLNKQIADLEREQTKATASNDPVTRAFEQTQRLKEEAVEAGRTVTDLVSTEERKPLTQDITRPSKVAHEAAKVGQYRPPDGEQVESIEPPNPLHPLGGSTNQPSKSPTKSTSLKNTALDLVEQEKGNEMRASSMMEEQSSTPPMAAKEKRDRYSQTTREVLDSTQKPKSQAQRFTKDIETYIAAQGIADEIAVLTRNSRQHSSNQPSQTQSEQTKTKQSQPQESKTQKTQHAKAQEIPSQDKQLSSDLQQLHQQQEQLNAKLDRLEQQISPQNQGQKRSRSGQKSTSAKSRKGVSFFNSQNRYEAKKDLKRNLEHTPLTTQQREKVHMARATLNDGKESIQYRGEAQREYLKEMGRRVKAYGEKTAIDPDTDREVASRLYVAGYDKKQVANAIMQNSPMCAGASEQDRATYAISVTKESVKGKVQTVRHGMDNQKQAQGISNERRLEKLGLATQMEKEDQGFEK